MNNYVDDTLEKEWRDLNISEFIDLESDVLHSRLNLLCELMVTLGDDEAWIEKIGEDFYLPRILIRCIGKHIKIGNGEDSEILLVSFKPLIICCSLKPGCLGAFMDDTFDMECLQELLKRVHYFFIETDRVLTAENQMVIIAMVQALLDAIIAGHITSYDQLHMEVLTEGLLDISVSSADEAVYMAGSTALIYLNFVDSLKMGSRVIKLVNSHKGSEQLQEAVLHILNDKGYPCEEINASKCAIKFVEDVLSLNEVEKIFHRTDLEVLVDIIIRDSGTVTGSAPLIFSNNKLPIFL